ncbi:MAG: YbaB/EbfC family nucleoid-associated protein [Anaerolineales bacterium]|nr:YbaB/EbfC family nucleoid-associated protein [Anaerolineales bacterium]MCB0009016.1 YbaB/EbfC family nucleoid-associated protein [Anaerolineales bacterium]MCB0010670.1 YbaB/EbfC family nucleoid-associated protein [Anaerolineales bacterium]MCB8962021.1 YbaB/EbfC family nucleoid-associated protein [Ardenticatenales bacterium]
MTKRDFRGRPKKTKGKANNPAGMLAQFQQMQEEMAKAQEDLASKSVTVTAGGGAIEIEITGHQRILGIKIDPDVIDPDDVEGLQDLLVAGINQAIEKSQEMSANQMEGLTGDMGLGDLLGGLGIG